MFASNIRRWAIGLALLAGCGGALNNGGQTGRGGSVSTGEGGVVGTGGDIAVGGRGGSIDTGTGGGGSSGACMPAPGATVPGGCVKLLASGRTSIAGLALDGANVIWPETQAGGYAVVLVPADGGTAQSVLGTAFAPIAIGGGSVYLQNGDGLIAMRIDLGMQPIPFQGFGRTAAADPTAVYSFRNGNSVNIASLNGAAPIWIYTWNPIGITVRDGTLHWTESGSFNSDSAYAAPGIFRAPSDGTAAAQPLLGGGSFAINHGGSSGGVGGGGMGGGAGGSGGAGGGGMWPANLRNPYGIAVDAAYVYWTDGAAWTARAAPASTMGSVARIPIGGGDVTVLASGLDGPGDLAIDDAALYFAGADGTIKKLALAGGEPVTLVAAQENPRGVIVDGSSVYWVSGQDASGSILKLTPK